MDLKKKILLVEDEPLIALAETAFLKRQGYEVLKVSNGAAAIESVEKEPSIDLILMDIDLGKGMDGTEAAQRILEKRDIPLLFLSSHSEADIVDRTYQIGAYGYVLKSAGETVLLASLRMAFKLFETRQIEYHERPSALILASDISNTVREEGILQKGNLLFSARYNLKKTHSIRFYL